MAASSFMDGTGSYSNGHLLVAVLFILLALNRTDAIPADELDSMLPRLRSRGYNRFGNAIVTSDLSFDLLSAQTLTLFAPNDSSLFALDMDLSSDSYVSILRSHAVPRRLTAADLILTQPSSLLPNLLPNRPLSIAVVRRAEAASIAVNGVQLEAPGLYYSRSVAVHGLAGALSFRSDQASGQGMASGVGSSPPARGVHDTLAPAPTLVSSASPSSHSPLLQYPSQINQALHGEYMIPPPETETSGAVPTRRIVGRTGGWTRRVF